MQRKVLLTGASRGIGRSIAKRLLDDGHRLSLGLREPEALRGTELDVDGVTHHAYDAMDPATAAAWVDDTVRQWGEIDTLIHCAGILHRTPLLFEDGEEHDLDELWAINVKGPWWLTRAAWPFLVASGQGRIQVLVSMSGKRVKGRMAGYPVSKFALMGLCQSMRNEGWGHGIRVTAICPSWVNTAMARSVTDVEPAAMTQPDDLASLASTLLSLPEASVPFEVAMNCALET
ncbi:short-chain dehydrogenase [Synechococcus sp. KORDI-52]|uniref:SDR family NAD(P)-dependent oxidoreductase n=1 Tax=Synechococcus sp. KORDI-52 TaxID=585425 RepID=UPI0004E0784F|nr:SDR family NAD(P)-dependent oxidoreductase [Synechococcus sp. KORDI-52]AII49529.1 short-chain dehydrogenase [Synechococcus sp. KORDI-52]